MKIIAITPNIKHDYLAESVIEGLKKTSVQIYATDFGNGITKVYSDDEIVEISNECDYIFVFWGKVRDNNPPKHYLLDRIKQPDKTIYIDGSEYTHTGYKGNDSWLNEYMLKNCKWYFKRECYPENILINNIIPLPFAAVDRYFNNKEIYSRKIIDIFCGFGQDKTGYRKNIKTFLDNYKAFDNIINHTVRQEDYHQYLANSYITIDSMGGGECNARSFEIIANKSCLMRQKYNIVIPNDFEDGKHIIEYKNMKDFDDKLNYYLNNLDLVQKMIIESYNHLVKYHTSQKRLEYIFNLIKK